ncbi:MAG: hypothetical protein D6781_14010 [Verrucomicrobia bacterium]|nr:MAG: hypothetical protein D6781_14010 [Verrucomicrobiota bacterium]
MTTEQNGLSLAGRDQWVVGILLAVLLAATRGHHVPVLGQLPSASWAVFFLAGVYIRPTWVFAALMTLAAVVDIGPHVAAGAGLGAVLTGQVAACVTPAYFTLIPAYGALWGAGRWYAGRHAFAVSSLWQLAIALGAGAVGCELFSSGGFYFLSGRFAQPNAVEFAGRFARYFPGSLATLAGYVGVCAGVHVALATIQRGVRRREEVVES